MIRTRAHDEGQLDLEYVKLMIAAFGPEQALLSVFPYAACQDQTIKDEDEVYGPVPTKKG